jgi:exopolysaccharide biosynthesis protein
VAGGRSLIRDGEDAEGFSAGSAQFDSDITVGRYPRAAIGIGGGLLWAMACDGRADEDAGMTLAEVAEFMLSLGVESAINLDGGGSTSLVAGGRLANRPRDEHGAPPHSGRPISTALAFSPRT